MTEHPFLERLRAIDPVARTGRVTRVLPTFIEADGPAAPLGALCIVEADPGPDRGAPVLAEVVGVSAEGVTLVPVDSHATFYGARVVAHTGEDRVPVGDGFLGRAVDGLGRPIDGLGAIAARSHAKLAGEATGPLERVSSRRMLVTGVRAIDGLLTLGEGQRVGLFAASGVGKTSLLTQIARQVAVDRCVVCLVGERGREVEALWSSGLPPEARARSALVAATSDQTAAMRVRAVSHALALAEHWRMQGHHVLLLLDSVTRLAMAMREIGLAAGEPPTVRAYTPSVFAAIPRLVERCGALRSGGAITAIMTVLSETDEVDDPVTEMMKSLLDGHIVLSRTLAEQRHYPAIDVPRSISRLAGRLMDAQHRGNAKNAVELLSVYQESRTLIEAGVYVAGGNADIDLALERRSALKGFLIQDETERTPLARCLEALATAVGGRA